MHANYARGGFREALGGRPLFPLSKPILLKILGFVRFDGTERVNGAKALAMVVGGVTFINVPTQRM